MAGDSPTANLVAALEGHSTKISTPTGTVLFRCGQKASGMFLILSGKVSLTAEFHSAPDFSYGPGALVGLPATITQSNYSMTAIVTENARLAFLNPEGLDSLLHEHPELCHELLVILENRIAENQTLVRSVLMRSA